ncbi:hypothetical protein SynMVIR181_00043 [Synechococcus sp. MVIR-18-1]|nr:hypothetical protein SynMVIR181_00043 [Synechococcus sp. MVIR-18-1]
MQSAIDISGEMVAGFGSDRLRHPKPVRSKPPIIKMGMNRMEEDVNSCSDRHRSN